MDKSANSSQHCQPTAQCQQLALILCLLCDCQVASVSLAESWVAAFFVRRSHAIARQKAEQLGDEEAADEAYELMLDAQDEEEAAKAKYYASISAPPQPAAAAQAGTAAVAATTASNPYGDVKVEPSSVDDDEGFM